MVTTRQLWHFRHGSPDPLNPPSDTGQDHATPASSLPAVSRGLHSAQLQDGSAQPRLSSAGWYPALDVPCFHPLRAFRTNGGTVVLGKEAVDSQPLALPCGNCIGCRTDKARQWALRCHLELQDHPSAVFTTLTYDSRSLPATLQKHHLAGFLKRLRKKKRGGIRFFAAGEYGERTNRPHYHAILYGCSEADRQAIADAWGMGIARTDPITPQRIAYCAGYCNKKVGYRYTQHEERVDPSTGEVYQWQPPFRQMSRRPGIGANARQWPQSWRLFGVHNGVRLPVPRYLHQAWQDIATNLQTEDLDYEKSQLKLSRNRELTPASLASAELLAQARHNLASDKRRSL